MRNWNIKWQLKAGMFAALLAISAGAQATPYCSIKALGMAGACVARGQDSLTAFFNPATAAEVDTRYDLEFVARWDNKKLVVGRDLMAPEYQDTSTMMKNGISMVMAASITALDVLMIGCRRAVE